MGLYFLYTCEAMIFTVLNFYRHGRKDLFNENSLRLSSPAACQSLLVSSTYMNLRAGLANNMWIYASAYGIARHNGMTLKLGNKLSLASAFQLDFNNIISDEAYNSINWVEVTDIDVKASCCTWMLFHEEIYNMSSVLQNKCNNYVRLHGYFQSWRYFREYENDTRRQFSFTYDVIKRVHTFLSNALSTWKVEHNRLIAASKIAITPVFVGIHVRLGDWPIVDKCSMRSYIRDAIFYFAAKFSHAIFVVCSNDVDWCRKKVKLSKKLKTNYSLVYSRNNNRLTDLAILSKCNHSIITYGTYGWWSAYLAGGITLYYNRTQHFIGFSRLTTNESHYFYPGWIPY